MNCNALREFNALWMQPVYHVSEDAKLIFFRQITVEDFGKTNINWVRHLQIVFHITQVRMKKTMCYQAIQIIDSLTKI